MVDHLPNIQLGLEEVTDEVRERVRGPDRRWRRKTVGFRYRGKRVQVPEDATLRDTVVELQRQDWILKLLISASRAFQELAEIEDATLWYDFSLERSFVLQCRVVEIAARLEEHLMGNALSSPSIFGSLADAHERTWMALSSALETTRDLAAWTPRGAEAEPERFKLDLARGRGLLDFFLRETFHDLVSADPREDHSTPNPALESRLASQKREGWKLLDTLDRLRALCRDYQPHAKQLEALADAVGTFLGEAERDLASRMLDAIPVHLDPLEPILDTVRELLRTPAVRLEEIVKLSERLDDLRQGCQALRACCASGPEGHSEPHDGAEPVIELLLTINHAFEDLRGAVDAWFAAVSQRKYLYESGRQDLD